MAGRPQSRGGRSQALLYACLVVALIGAAAGCAPGEYYKKGVISGSCTSCDAGQYSAGADGNEPTSCTECVSGRRSAKGVSSCTGCAAGTYANAQHTQCPDCNDGQISAEPGAQGSCQGCEAGRYSNAQHTACDECATGRSSPASAGTCDPCGAGKHSNAARTDCPSCARGQYSTGDTSSCTGCALGRFAAQSGSSKCESCVPGKYSSNTGAFVCDDCPANALSAGGSSAVTACRCNPGYTGVISSDASTCTACEAGQVRAASSPPITCSECELGQYQDQTGQPSCISCGALKGCQCQGKTNAWPSGAGGICRQGEACIGTGTCLEHATCKAEGAHGHTCDCNSEDVFGLTCERNCVSKPDPDDPNQAWCGNLGSCVYDPDTDTGYHCKCKQGYSGPNCLKIDPCIVHAPCRNGGRCDNVTVEPRGYDCHCPTGFTGVNCSVLLTAWDESSNDRGLRTPTVRHRGPLLFVGALASALYFGVYWILLQSLDGDDGHTRAVISLIVLVGACLGFAVATALSQPCEASSGLNSVLANGAHLSSSTGAVGDFETCSEFVSEHSFRTNGFTIYGIAAAATILQSMVAVQFHRRIDRCFPDFATAGASRLLRGAGLALISLVAASPGIAAGLILNPNRLDPTRVDTVADAFVIYGWHPIVFGVLVPSLPIGVVLSRVYRKEQLRDRGNCVGFLMECGVPRPELFLLAERSLASFAGALLPFFWNSHLVNEQQEFLSFSSANRSVGTSGEVRYSRENREFASVDGVRSLSPVVCSLNLVAAGWGCYMISTLPAPLVWTPSLFFGAAWSLVAAFVMVATSAMVIMSLSESRRDAAERNMEIIWGWGQHCTHGSLRHQCDAGAGYCHDSIIDAERMPTRRERLLELYYCIRTYITSWTGQTVISGLNHLLAIGFFTYGLNEFSEHLTPELKKFLVSGLVLTSIGVITSTMSFFQRRWPDFKVSPTDDSFRLACVLKALLVMNKALIVYELSKIDMRMLTRLRTWTLWVTAVCVLSVFILALLTYAFDAFKIYARPMLVENAGIQDGKKFVKMYSLSFVCCKLATAFLVVLGHIPELAGCNEEIYSFKGNREMLLNRAGSSTIECGVCLPNNRANERHCDDHATSTYYPCNTTCAKLFFSGGEEMPISLDVFVLVPILWLPFMVYSNNEVARVIDGIWERRRNAMSESGRLGLHTAARVGLSTTGHGYSSIANLAHAVFLLCGVAHIYFLITIFASTKHFGYSVDAPLGHLLDDKGVAISTGGVPQELGSALQAPLDAAGRYVTWSVVALNLLTLCRFFYEKLPCCSSGERDTTAGSSAGQQMRQSLLGGQAAASATRNRWSERTLCMYGCGRLPTPGRRPNGEPYDTCCRACATAQGALSPAQHDAACMAREQERHSQLAVSE